MKVISIFFAVFAAITASIFVFAPDRLPTGMGISAIPVQATVRPSLLGQGKVAKLRNSSSKTLHNAKVVLRNKRGAFVKKLEREIWPPGEFIELGWLEGWEILEGTKLSASASGYYSQAWQY